jgi:hypothetical protein
MCALSLSLSLSFCRTLSAELARFHVPRRRGCVVRGDVKGAQVVVLAARRVLHHPLAHAGHPAAQEKRGEIKGERGGERGLTMRF